MDEPFAEDGTETPDGGPISFIVPETLAGERADKALAALAPPWLSRSRLRALIEDGAVRRDGAVVREPKAKVKAGEAWELRAPPPTPAEPEAQAIPLSVAYEDAHLIVVDKPAGMVVHPAPGAPDGTLVNALLHHCAGALSGVGGVARPGIVHRIDKDTSGLLVAAKTDAAHQGLSALFAAHDVDREYQAICRGAPDPGSARLRGLPGVEAEPGGWLRVEGLIGRHPSDRKKMAARVAQGRNAVTRLRTEAAAGPADKPVAARVVCRLETGRTHQIRVHMAWLGHPLIGDPVYGRVQPVAEAAMGQAGQAALAAFPRQALHAGVLGFAHPVGGAPLRFEAPPPADFAGLAAALGL
ncbi:MAG: RluA family pseudouridine synthase [Pseudomonadota bacterium]